MQNKKQGERNPGASVLAKLRNHAKATGEEVPTVLARYTNERFLYRLSLSPYAERFVLRGATLFSVWLDTPHRPTRDLDMLALGDSDTESVRALFAQVCTLSVPEDGVTFLPETLRIEERIEGRAYKGFHLDIESQLGTARPRLELDLAFGEAVTPNPEEIELPCLLNQPRPKLRAYPRETAIAEKTEALVDLGLLNSRLKDFYDLWFLAETFAFEGTMLSAALSATFTRRGTPFPPAGLPIALTAAFSTDPTKQSQWERFAKKGLSRRPPVSLESTILQLRVFLQPLLVALAEERPFVGSWEPGGPWTV